jgi:hypothetical protein
MAASIAATGAAARIDYGQEIVLCDEHKSEQRRSRHKARRNARSSR